MQISRLRTILTSAYLTGMLTSAMPVVRADAQLASAVNLGEIVAGLKTAGFQSSGTSTVQTITPPAAAPAPAPQAEEPVMTEELMARLLAVAQGSKKETEIRAAVCKIFGLTDGSVDIKAKQASEPVPGGRHVITVPTDESLKKNIIIAYARENLVEFYLTDKTGKLRAAAVSDRAGLRLITNEQAAEKYKIEMELFAKIAKGLPPTGTSVAAGNGNS